MAFKRGDSVTIPVLKRHITHSSGECKANTSIINQSCVMADAIRDKFPGAKNVSVSPGGTSFILGSQEVSLSPDSDMVSVINTFDRTMDLVYEGKRSLKDAIRIIWSQVPRRVHATVGYVYND